MNGIISTYFTRTLPLHRNNQQGFVLLGPKPQITTTCVTIWRKLVLIYNNNKVYICGCPICREMLEKMNLGGTSEKPKQEPNTCLFLSEDEKEQRAWLFPDSWDRVYCYSLPIFLKLDGRPTRSQPTLLHLCTQSSGLVLTLHRAKLPFSCTAAFTVWNAAVSPG